MRHIIIKKHIYSINIEKYRVEISCYWTSIIKLAKTLLSMDLVISPKRSWFFECQFKNHKNINSKTVSDCCFECLQAIKCKENENLAYERIFGAS